MLETLSNNNYRTNKLFLKTWIRNIVPSCGSHDPISLWKSEVLLQEGSSGYLSFFSSIPYPLPQTAGPDSQNPAWASLGYFRLGTKPENGGFLCDSETSSGVGWDFQGAQNNAQMHFSSFLSFPFLSFPFLSFPFQRKTWQDSRSTYSLRIQGMLGWGDRRPITVPHFFYDFIYQLQPHLCQLVCRNFTLDPWFYSLYIWLLKN